ncbi:uncharacterized protein LOC125949608 [Anopheles darlingi]|uniref:uncharacterized protein LOC125949608 n=1 Tax=Anopheles darlingi TaxID=43151 RepID=UPI00210065AA|nr:uncharacterized protein LOC125949608 [Anopheles darlingi]
MEQLLKRTRKQKECMENLKRTNKTPLESEDLMKNFSLLSGLLEQVNMRKLKSRRQQNTLPTATEKDVLNMNKLLELIYGSLKDYTKLETLTDHAGRGAKPFEKQMIEIQQLIDLMSIEITKLKTVSDAIEGIHTNYETEIGRTANEPENETDL